MLKPRGLGELSMNDIPCKHGSILKRLRHDILSHFFDVLNYGWKVEKPKIKIVCKNEGEHQRSNSKTKRNKDGWGWTRLKRIGNNDFEKFRYFFQNTRTWWRKKIVMITVKPIDTMLWLCTRTLNTKVIEGNVYLASTQNKKKIVVLRLL